MKWLKKLVSKCKEWWLELKPLIATPTMLISFLLAWLITNGWAYAMLGLGIWFDIAWAKAVSGAYLTFLWLPFTPEKLITIPLALFIQKVLFRRKIKNDYS